MYHFTMYSLTVMARILHFSLYFSFYIRFDPTHPFHVACPSLYSPSRPRGFSGGCWSWRRQSDMGGRCCRRGRLASSRMSRGTGRRPPVWRWLWRTPGPRSGSSPYGSAWQTGGHRAWRSSWARGIPCAGTWSTSWLACVRLCAAPSVLDAQDAPAPLCPADGAPPLGEISHQSKVWFLAL